VQQGDPSGQGSHAFDDVQNGNDWHHRIGDRFEMLSPGSRSQALPLYGHQLGQVQSERLSPFDGSAPQGPATGANVSLLQHQQEQRGVSHLQNAIQAAAGEPMSRQESGMLSPMGESASLVAGVQQAQANGDKRGPVEFNHAISYVNKIKVSSSSFLIKWLTLRQARIASRNNQKSTNNFLRYYRLINVSQNQSKMSTLKLRTSSMERRTSWKISSSFCRNLQLTQRRLLPNRLQRTPQCSAASVAILSVKVFSSKRLGQNSIAYLLSVISHRRQVLGETLNASDTRDMEMRKEPHR